MFNTGLDFECKKFGKNEIICLSICVILSCILVFTFWTVHPGLKSELSPNVNTRPVQSLENDENWILIKQITSTNNE